MIPPGKTVEITPKHMTGAARVVPRIHQNFRLGAWPHIAALAFYYLCYSFAAIVFGIFFPLRVSGRNAVPRSGGVLIVANHQSFLDPIIIGLTVGRRLRCPARSTLFRWFPLGWFFETLGALKIEREGVAKEGMKKAAAALSSGECVGIWPEGTRTFDGQLGTLKPGLLLLVRRAQVPVVICGIAGAFESWPRSAWFPRPNLLWAHYETFNMPTESTDAQLAALRTALEAAVGKAAAKRNVFLRH